MIVIGLTGSIGMGKTTVARMFADMGVPVHDSDAAVHRLLGPGGAAVGLVDQYFKGVRIANMIDRKRLSKRVFESAENLANLERILHPLVRHDSESFIQHARANGASMAVLDIPLLFETGRHHDVDFSLVVSAPQNQQRQRVLRRAGMTEALFTQIKAKQLPDVDKRKMADFVIPTGNGKAYTRRKVKEIVTELSEYA